MVLSTQKRKIKLTPEVLLAQDEQNIEDYNDRRVVRSYKVLDWFASNGHSKMVSAAHITAPGHKYRDSTGSVFCVSK